MADWWESAPLANAADDSWWKSAPVYKPGVAEDIAKTIPAGLARGVAGGVGLPGFLQDYIADPIASLPGRAYNYFAGSGKFEDTPSMAAGRAAVPRYGPGDVLTAESALRAVEAVTGPLYKPQTLPGEIVNTGAEMLPNALGGGSAFQRAARVLVPTATSEAAGQATRQIAPGLEPAARAVGGIAGGVGTAIAQRPGTAGGLIREAAPNLTDETITRARAIIDYGASLPEPVAITWPEAIQQVTRGGTRLADLQRVVENSAGGGGVMRPYMAERAGQVQRAGNAEIGRLSDTQLDPIETGIRTQQAATAAMGDTPQGQALAQTVARAAPRVTPDEAGAVIQPALRQVYDAREAARASAAAREYGAARNAPADVLIQAPDIPPRPAPVFPDEASGGGAAAPAGRRPETMGEFIARNGGIGLERGDARAAGFDQWTIPFHGRVARESGRGIDDFWRERLVEEGFLPPDAGGGMARNVHDEVLSRLAEERSGRPTFRIQDQERAAGSRGAAGRASDEEAYYTDLAREDIVAAARRAGMSSEDLDPAFLDRAASRLAARQETDPLQAYENAVMSSAEPAPRGGAATFGQVDATPVVQHIDAALQSARGSIRESLERARRALLTPGGDVDFTVAGLHNSRTEIADAIGAATRAGRNNEARELLGVQQALDRALEEVPAYAAARRGFEQRSRPLDPFEPGRPLGRVVERDQFDRRYTLPQEAAPGAIEGGGVSAARDFTAAAPAPARAAYENYLASQLVEGARDVTGNISADALRRVMVQREDELRQFPGVVDRIREIVGARRGMAPVEAGPLGQMSRADQVMQQARALLPNQPAAGLDASVSQTVRRIVRRDPEAATNLLRTYMQTVFDEAIQNNVGGPNAFGGARFAAVLMGNPQQARNMEAGLRALPNGHERWAGIRRFLDVLEATGQRQPAGSQTAFNQAIQDQLRRGGVVGEAASIAASGGLNAPARLRRWYEELRLGRNTEALARLFTDPGSEGLLRRLAQEPAGSGRAQALALRLTYLAGSGQRSGSAKPSP